jgi:hypothetical protein
MTIIQAGYVAQWLGANGVMDQRGAAALWGNPAPADRNQGESQHLERGQLPQRHISTCDMETPNDAQ